MSTAYLDIVDASGGSANGSHKTSKLDLGVVLDTATTIPSLPFVIPVTLPLSASDILVYAPCDLIIVDAWFINTSGAGGAETLTVKSGATAVTTAMNINVAAGVIVRDALVNTTVSTFLSGATITIHPSAAVNAGKLYLACIPA